MHRFILVPALALVLAVPALASYESRPVSGGFQGPSAVSVDTAAEALKARVDSLCILEGSIISSTNKHEHYIFQDGTGKIVVKLEDEIFEGRTITPDSKIRIHGEIEAHYLRDSYVEAEKLEVLS